MAEITTALNIRGLDGTLLDLTRDLVKTHPTLNQPSIVEKVANAMTSGVSTRYPEQHLKKVKRDNFLRDVSQGTGQVAEYVDPTNLTFDKFWTKRFDRIDNIILNRYDEKQVEQQYSILGAESGDFILTSKEKDLNYLVNEEFNILSTLPIYTSASATGAATGVQPALTTASATSITAIENGQRLTGVITDLDADDTNRIKLLRAAIGSLQRIGSPKSAETLYPFSINGIGLDQISIMTDYKNVLNIKDSFTRTVIDLSNPNAVLNFTGIVGYVDKVPVYLTNQLPANVIYRVASNRALLRKTPSADDLAYIGAIKDVATAVINGTAKSLGPSDKLLQYELPVILANAYFEESIMIQGV